MSAAAMVIVGFLACITLAGTFLFCRDLFTLALIIAAYALGLYRSHSGGAR